MHKVWIHKNPSLCNGKHSHLYKMNEKKIGSEKKGTKERVPPEFVKIYGQDNFQRNVPDAFIAMWFYFTGK